MIQKAPKDVEVLKQERQELSEHIKDLIRIYQIDKRLFTPEIWFNLINLPRFSELDDDSMLGIMDLRAKFRQEHKKEVEKLIELDKEIYSGDIDLALEKVRKLAKELELKE